MSAPIGNKNRKGYKDPPEVIERKRTAALTRQPSLTRAISNKIKVMDHLENGDPNCNCFGHKWHNKREKGFCILCLRDNMPICQDHCHNTNVLRGKICMQCNMALGMIHDDIPTLQRMIEYLLSYMQVAEANGYDPQKAIGIAERVAASLK